MTNLERTQTDFDILRNAYAMLRGLGASNALQLEMLNYVNSAHATYMIALHQAIADAAQGIARWTRPDCEASQ